MSFAWFELFSYVVTIFGLPLAILIFLYEQRKERQNEEELYQRLSDEYTNFLKLVLENADLQLLRMQGHDQSLTNEQREKTRHFRHSRLHLRARLYFGLRR